MPPFEAELDDGEIWDLVHYLRSIGPKELRPMEPPLEGAVLIQEN